MAHEVARTSLTANELLLLGAGPFTLNQATNDINTIAANVNGTLKDYDRTGDYSAVEIGGLYWHFVDLVWVFIFAFFYLW